MQGMDHHLFRVFLALGLGFIFLAIDVLATPVTSSRLGFPIAYGTLIDCYLSGPGGCGYSYNIALLVLDFLFWALVGFAVVFLLEILGITYDFGKKKGTMSEHVPQLLFRESCHRKHGMKKPADSNHIWYCE